MKSKKSTDDKDDKNHIYRRVTVSLAREEHSSFSDEEVMNHPGMVRLMGYLESLPVAERILEFTVQSSEEERQNQSGFRVHETEEARRMREIEEDRKNYMNRFFR
jgi:hypothetical protein